MTDYKALYEQQLAENEKLKEEIFLTKMKLASANENADVERHNEEAGIILAENDKLRDEVRDLKKLIEYRNQMDKLERKMMGKDID
jgi:hypothetical protein